MSYFIILLIYLLASYLIWLIAKKLDDKLATLAWFPFLSDYLITRLAQKPFYWWILMYIPVLNIYYDFLLWRAIFKRFNRNFLYALLMMVPILNWTGLLLLAYFFVNPEIKTALSENNKDNVKAAEEEVTKIGENKDEKTVIPDEKKEEN